jgi:sporulation protein YlmC with PRC-barrel domain
MRVEFGATVYTSDDHELGAIDRLIVDASTGRLRSVAIRQGRLLKHDIEVPLAAFQAGDDGRLRLNVSSAGLDAFPRFDEDQYTRANDQYARDLGSSPETVMLPSNATNVLIDTLADQSVAAVEASRQLELMFSQLDLENAVVGAGSPVRSSDGQEVGRLRSVSFDDSGRARWFSVDGVAGGPADLTLPVTAVERVADGVIDLKVAADWVGAWGSVAPGMEVWSSDDQRVGRIDECLVDSLLVTSDDLEHPIRVPMRAVDVVGDSRVTLTQPRSIVILWRGGA